MPSISLKTQKAENQPQQRTKMSCCRPRTLSPTKYSSQEQPKQENLTPESKNVKHEVLLRTSRCKVHLMEEGEAQNLPTETSLYFVYSMKTLSVFDENVVLATTIKVGDDLQQRLHSERRGGFL